MKNYIAPVLFSATGLFILGVTGYLMYEDINTPRADVTLYNTQCIKTRTERVTETEGLGTGFLLGYATTGTATGGLVGMSMLSSDKVKYVPYYDCTFQFDLLGTNYKYARRNSQNYVYDGQVVRVKVKPNGIYF